MKKIISYGVLFLFTGILFPAHLFSQSVAINADSSKADASAILDLKSTKKGLLVPRMTMAQRNVITAPATGLLIYQTDNTAGYYYYTGAAWTPLQSTGGTGTGNYWSANGNDIFNSNIGNVSIGTMLPLSKLTVKTPLNATGFTHLGVTDSTGTDSVLVAEKIFSSYKVHVSGFTSTIPATVSFGTVKSHALQLHAGTTGWLNLIPDGSVTLGDSAGTHGYFGSKLAVKANAGTKAISVLSSDGVLLSMYGAAVGSGVGTFTANDMNIYANSIPVITANGAGSVGINATNPTNKFQVGNTSPTGITNYDFAVGNGTHATGLFLGANYSEMTSSTNMTFFPNYGNGFMGINTNSPQNKFQIGYTAFSGFDFAIGSGSSSFGISQGNITQIVSSGNIGFSPKNGSGNVGINEVNPINKLQIGSMGAVGFNGNDLAIGNGTQATGIAQTATNFQIASSTGIALLPSYGGTGRVGVNTTTPIAPLDVEGSINMQGVNQNGVLAYFGLSYGDFSKPEATSGGSVYSAYVSIYAASDVMAQEFDAVSDARIKSIIGISDSKKDLRTINAIQITDYSFKDKVKYGNKPFKKVIAQQVETVYPQVVSKHVDFVPNVYQVTSSIEKTPGGYLLSFAGNHNISQQAKKLQVFMDDSNSKKEFDIISIPSPNQVIIQATALNASRLFVYGEEVNDFRSVDYEGLATLNISATQELNKELMELKKTVADQNKKIDMLVHQLVIKEKPVIKLSRFQNRSSVVKHRARPTAPAKTSIHVLKTAVALN